MKVQWTLVIGLIFAITIAVFATMNVGKVPINYIFGEASWPLILVILGSVLAGFIISFCFSAFRMLSSQHQTKAVKKELEQMRVLLNEKDSEILHLKEKLKQRGDSALVGEKIVGDFEAHRDGTN